MNKKYAAIGLAGEGSGTSKGQMDWNIFDNYADILETEADGRNPKTSIIGTPRSREQVMGPSGSSKTVFITLLGRRTK